MKNILFIGLLIDLNQNNTRIFYDLLEELSFTY